MSDKVHITGKHAIKEAILNQISIDKVLIDYSKKEATDIKEIIELCRAYHIQTRFKPLHKMAFEGPIYQGMVAYLRPKNHLPLNQLIADPKSFPIVLALDHLEDPYNFGAILRTAVLLNVSAVIYPKDRQVSLSPGVIKASSGAANIVPLVKVTNLGSSIQSLKSAGYWAYGANSKSGTSLDLFKPAFPLLVVIGNESKGLSQRTASLLDVDIHIPTHGQIDSLNVSVATGIIVYELTKHMT